MNKDKDIFFSMVEKWTVHDYCAPGIKTEVILDMLLSEFIEALIEYHYKVSKKKDGKYKYGEEVKVKMLTKEFPIKTEAADLRNAKVDYLVSIDGEQLILVELKTTKDSFKKEQRKLMKKAIDKGVKDIIGFYCEIIKSKTGNRLDEKKYRNTFYELYRKESSSKEGEKCRLDENKFKEYKEKLDFNKFKKCVNNFGEELIKKYENKKVDYLYILIVPDSRIDKDRQLVLSNYCDGKDGEKKFKKYIEESKDEVYCKRWALVSEILKKCIEFAEPQKGRKDEY